MKERERWFEQPPMRADEAARLAALARQQTLTKPDGALGRLESLAVDLAALQRRATPSAERVHVVVYAADHGIAADGVSAFPQSVTAAMIKNFAQGGAAISVLARTLGATLKVIDLGTVFAEETIPGVESCRLGPGTANFTCEPAMTLSQVERALAIGRSTVEAAHDANADVYVGGEMGIGNTTSAAALGCALLDLAPELVCGPGTGLDAAGVKRKINAVRRALALHTPALTSPFEALRRLGGFEIAALAGSYIACAQLGLPALVDGFIATSAAAVAVKLNERIKPWLLYTHVSGEPGHRPLLDALNARPLLDLGMRLGEGTGAAVAVPILRMACALHNEMATFETARVAGRTAP